MTIKARINNDLKDAMRAQDKNKLGAMRLITAAIKQVEVDERIDVDDARMLVILDKMAKQRNESISQYKTAGRDDLVAQEQFELDIITHYLPTPLTESEINQMIEDAIQSTGALKMSDMGKVMAELKPKMQGRADMGKISGIIKTKLS